MCVVSLEDINVTPETVPFGQCREVRTVSSASSNMDKITIAASAAICGTIVVAVIVFVAASRRRSRKLHEIHQQKMGMKHGIPIAGLPVNCCTSLQTSPGEPLSSLATLNAFNNNKVRTCDPLISRPLNERYFSRNGTKCPLTVHTVKGPGCTRSIRHHL